VGSSYIERLSDALVESSETRIALPSSSVDGSRRQVSMMAGTVYLMYHELQIPGRKLCQEFSGHLRYAVLQCEFRKQLSYLMDHKWRGLSVNESLADSNPASPRVAITFDDGSETDLIGAAPLLKEAGFDATFYIIVGWLGRPGYLSVAQLRELAESGFEIGCHSMNHRYLTSLNERELGIEIAEAKAHLEQILGLGVNHLSCPGGFWSRRVARAAKLAGYHSVATSRTGVNDGRTDPYCLARLTMTRGTVLPSFARVCRGEGLFARRTKEAILSVPKCLLGADSYVRVHSVLHRTRA
jgi:peptidoglycan/xylan/chitin deacetylase (PgdA/CDA1 family)